MRVRDLEPELRDGKRNGDPALTVPEAWGLHMTCPCGQHKLWLPFQSHTPEGDHPAWCAQGTTLDDITFVDSPRGTRSVRCFHDCKCHFNIVSGAIEFYHDSGFKA